MAVFFHIVKVLDIYNDGCGKIEQFPNGIWKAINDSNVSKSIEMFPIVSIGFVGDKSFDWNEADRNQIHRYTDIHFHIYLYIYSNIVYSMEKPYYKLNKKQLVVCAFG